MKLYQSNWHLQTVASRLRTLTAGYGVGHQGGAPRSAIGRVFISSPARHDHSVIWKLPDYVVASLGTAERAACQLTSSGDLSRYCPAVGQVTILPPMVLSRGDNNLVIHFSML